MLLPFLQHRLTLRVATASAFLLLAVSSSLGVPRVVMVQSRSKQFIVHGPNPVLSRPTLSFGKPDDRVRLEPALLAVSCERIKEALLTELGIPPRQRSSFHTQASPDNKIYVVIHPRQDDGIMLEAISTDKGWTYRVTVPENIESHQLVSVVVKALLLDMAQRSAPGRTVELPEWLSEGFATHLEANALEPLTLRANVPITQAGVRSDPASGRWAILGRGSASAQSRVRLDPVGAARERLRITQPLSFEEINWPENLPADRFGLFRDSAHLLVQELLRLPNGPALFRELVLDLPNHLNWQFAFLRAYHGHFESMLEVEKWWGLTLSYSRIIEPAQKSRLEESWRTLERALRIPVQVHASADALPIKDFLSLQRVIEEGESPQQRPTLESAVQQLALMQLRLSTELLPLVDEYRITLQNYLRLESQAGPATPRRGRQPVNLNVLKRSTCRQLDLLDQQRAALRPKLFPSSRDEAILSALEMTDRKTSPTPQTTEAEAARNKSRE